MQSQSIQRTEQAIANGTYAAYPFRVYTRTNSPVHIEAGADFSLEYSFKTEEMAKEHADEINEKGFYTAVVIAA